jgi:hypothetical protein
MQPDKTVEKLAVQKFPPDLSRTAERTLEFRCAGNQLTAVLNGTVTLSATDNSFSSGTSAVVLRKGALVEKVEVMDFDGK